MVFSTLYHGLSYRSTTQLTVCVYYTDFTTFFIYSGAVLINQLIQRDMKEEKAAQQKKLDEISQRMETIRDRYREQQNRISAIVEPQTYAQGKSDC